MKQFHALPKFGPERFPVDLHLPWLGVVSAPFENHIKVIKPAVKQQFSAVQPCVVYLANELLSIINKDIRLALKKNQRNLSIRVHCDSRQRLQNRIKERVP